MSYDVARVRGLVPALGGRMGAPRRHVRDAAAGRRRSTAGGPFPASRPSAEIDTDARLAVADVVDADPRGVVLGPGGPAELLRLHTSLDELQYRAVAAALATLDRPGPRGTPPRESAERARTAAVGE